jgi:hypothetical protein
MNAMASRGKFTEAIDQVGRINQPGRFHIDQAIRPLVDGRVLSLEREADRAWAEDHDPFTVPDRMDHEAQIGSLGFETSIDGACRDASV